MSTGLAVVVLALAAVSTGAAATGPALRVVGMQPLVVRGVAFHPGERVAVTAMTLFDIGGYAYWDETRRRWEMRADWKTHLNENAQFLPLNVHTGQLYARE